MLRIVRINPGNGEVVSFPAGAYASAEDSDLGIDSAGNFYVLASASQVGTVRKFGPSGTFQGEIPPAVNAGTLAIGPSDAVFTVDVTGAMDDTARILRIVPNQAEVGSFSYGDRIDTDLVQLAIDSVGNFYLLAEVGDLNRHPINKFDPQGAFLGDVPTDGLDGIVAMAVARSAGVLPTSTPTPLPSATPTVSSITCVGDCNGDRTVTVDELIAMVNIDLGTADASACPYGLPSGAEVDVALIIQAVNNALNECSG